MIAEMMMVYICMIMATESITDRRSVVHFPDESLEMVGVKRFELLTFWSRTKRATRLRYTPV